MLKKLRLKFIVLNMAIVAIVLALALCTICLFSRQQEISTVQTALETSLSLATASDEMRPHDEAKRDNEMDETVANGATAPRDAANLEGGQSAENGQGDAQEQFDTLPQGVSPNGFVQDDSSQAGDALQNPSPPEIGGRQTRILIQPKIPVATYRISERGNTLAVASGATATISSEVLFEAVPLLTDAADGTGELSSLGLLYQKRTVGNSVYVAFADSAEANSWQKLALILLGVGILALAVFFVISLFFSKWALRPVERAWESQIRFVADASHDLKTPLTIILANNSIIRKHPDALVGEMEQWLESTEYEAHEMQSLVGDMLLLAQLDEVAGKKTDVTESNSDIRRVDLSKMAQGEVLQFESVAFENGLTLKDEISADIVVAGEEAKLKRLMSTLIDNACKYADSQGTVTVSLRRSTDGAKAEFSVHNTGPTIPENDLPYVFDRFYRADKARAADTSRAAANDGAKVPTTFRKSHGLGLAIARSIAEEHRGTLTVASDQVAGTTFTATLPLLR